ncbi:unnamed protein product [Rotaria sordida]|uniref:Uncharacterized protein n=1 Tax=Rotaria sordida TaxID=392033 RepID=A0A814RPJ7_9BILA|nr:unnamed protein product [Rotaria sordida]
MPTSSAAVAGDYMPKYTWLLKLQSRSPQASAKLYEPPQSINADISAIDEIPSIVKETNEGLLSSTACKALIAGIVLCVIGAVIAIPVALVLTSSTGERGNFIGFTII